MSRPIFDTPPKICDKIMRDLVMISAVPVPLIELLIKELSVDGLKFIAPTR